MKTRVLTVTLNPAIDKSVIIPDFVTGKDFRIQSYHASAGGKGINVSQALSHLEIENIATGFLGGENGMFIRNQLNREKIKHDFVLIKGNSRHNLTIIEPGSVKLTRVLEAGPKVTNKDLSLFCSKYRKLLEKCSYVTLSGRNASGAPDDFYAKLIKKAKQENKFVVLDTSSRAYSLGIKQKPSMIKPNLEEAQMLLGEKLNTPAKIKKALLSIQKKGIHVVAITLGSRGGYISDGKQMLQAKVPGIKRKNPVGCGDAFIAGFLAAHSKGKNLGDCFRSASAAGTANALSINPGFIQAGTIKKIIKQVKIKSLKF